MATELRDRLTDLAAHTPPASPPSDLWDRGVRRRRVVAAGRAAMALVLMLLVGLGGWGWQANRTVQSADTHGSAHFPDRFFAPSPWLHSFSGPPGPLVAIGLAGQESLLHSRLGVYGVTATDATYGFLDLPGFVDGGLGNNSFSLSPDGRAIAYWETGRPTGQPFKGSFALP